MNFGLREVQPSGELDRVLRIPRRTWSEADAQDLAQRLSALFRTPQGQMTLRPIQAIALTEIGLYGGGFFPIRVGGGKTLISLLAPRMVPTCRRPLLLLPAALRDKTRHEMAELRRHWVLPPLLRIESYDMISRVNAAEFLSEYDPDMVICDEAHRLKNPKTAVTRRVARFMKERRGQIPFVVMSGTITKRSIKDFAHLTNWSLPRTNPCPEKHLPLEEWSCALDVNVSESRRLGPGALVAMCEPGENVRDGFRRRLVETPGVVATQEGPLPIPLTIRAKIVKHPPEIVNAFRQLRDTWTTPDDHPVADAPSIWRHARELTCGFYYRWDPRPPADWMGARSAWASACRDILSNNRRNLDSELQVTMAVDHGHYPWAEGLLAEWREIAPSFEPNTVPVWITDHTARMILDWAQEPGLIWVATRAMGEALARTGLDYYGQDATNAAGHHVMHHPPDRAAVVSMHSCRTGQNLQRFHRNLLVDIPPNGEWWEQLLGRTHRDGQTQPVSADLLFGCVEDVTAFWRSVADAGYAESITGQAQKLCYADTSEVIEPDEIPSGPAWRKR